MSAAWARRPALLCVLLLAGCGGRASTSSPPTLPVAEGCRPATYTCSVLGARAGVSSRARLAVSTGGDASEATLTADGFRCDLVLESVAPGEHRLTVTCVAGDARETFVLVEPPRAHHTDSDGVEAAAFSIEPACWYAQEGHVRGDCDTCRAVDYCDGPDVE